MYTTVKLQMDPGIQLPEKYNTFRAKTLRREVGNFGHLLPWLRRNNYLVFRPYFQYIKWESFDFLTPQECEVRY
jgi:hypothetical protein